MFELWRGKYITMPSDFWNASAGDKIVLRAFYEKDIEEKNEIRTNLQRNNTPIYPATIV